MVISISGQTGFILKSGSVLCRGVVLDSSCSCSAERDQLMGTDSPPLPGSCVEKSASSFHGRRRKKNPRHVSEDLNREEDQLFPVVWRSGGPEQVPPKFPGQYKSMMSCSAAEQLMGNLLINGLLRHSQKDS